MICTMWREMICIISTVYLGKQLRKIIIAGMMTDMCVCRVFKMILQIISGKRILIYKN